MKIGQGTRILILIALIIAAVAVWYSLFFAGKQKSATAAAPHPAQESVQTKTSKKHTPVAVTTSARALQVLPIPLLVAEAPENEMPAKPEVAKSQGSIANVNVPPNPFVPFSVSAQKAPTKPKEVPESRKPVLVTSEAGLSPNIPLPKTITPSEKTSSPPPASMNLGALPIRLGPLTKEVSGVKSISNVAPEAETQIEVQPVIVTNFAEEAGPAPENEDGVGSTPIAGTGSLSESDIGGYQPDIIVGEVENQPLKEPAASSDNEEKASTATNPLKTWAAQQKLRLEGIALGPVGVAIFRTANGYLALPVGQTFPDKSVLVKTITADRVLLVDRSGSNTLTLELGGGE